MYKLALVQMHVGGGEKRANLDRARAHIEKAAAAPASIVILPEAMTLGWTHSSAQTLADEIPGGESCAVLCDAARRNGVFVCSGLVERAGSSIFNSAVLIDPAGEIILHHRKINEQDIARQL